MTLIKGVIGLNIRIRNSEAEESEYNQRANQRWLKQLPSSNLGETSRLVYKRIFNSNGLLLDAKNRVEFLEGIENEVGTILSSLKKHYQGQSVSLTTKQKKIANLCLTLQNEMAIGYKTVIEDLISDEKYDSKLLPLCVGKVFSHLHSIQLINYQLYRELPKNFWYELHLLYQLAEQNQFIEISYQYNNSTKSILNTYKKILLLSTANPNQLRQKDIESISSALVRLSNGCEINTDPEGDYDFVINLQSDSPPFHRTLLKDELKANYRGVSIHELVIALQDELKSMNGGKSNLKLDDPLLRHLLSAWGTLTTRIFSRSSGTGTIKVSIGLSACHFLINRELFNEVDDPINLEGDNLLSSLEGSLKDAIVVEHEDDQLNHLARSTHPNLNSTVSGPMIKTDLLWDNIYVNKSVGRTDETNKPYDFMRKSRESEVIQDKFDYNDATLINVSPGGYCLKLDGVLPKQTRNGEIIGLLELKNDGSHIWNIGNIRWMQRHDTGELQLGIQLIAPNAIPVYAQRHSSLMDDLNYQRCLLLPALTGIGQPPTILTPTAPFAVNQEIQLKNEDSLQDIHLTKLISSGRSFKQFEYNQLDLKASNELNSDDDTDLDSVWELI